MRSSNILFWAITLLFAGGIAYVVLHGKEKIAPPPVLYIAGQPRTAQPMEAYTHFFKRKSFAVENGKGRLAYHWFQPQGAPYPPGLKFPLVVVLHGAPGSAYAAKFLITSKMQINFPSFIAVPVLPAGMKWALPDAFPNIPSYHPLQPGQKGLPYTVDLVKSLAAEYPVDSQRIYVIGCSEGGSGVLGAALSYPDVFAAGVALSSTWNAGDGPKMTGMPMWMVHGATDSVFKAAIARNVANSIKQAGGKTAYTEIPDMGHECPSPRLYTQATWQWLFSHHKNKPFKTSP